MARFSFGFVLVATAFVLSLSSALARDAAFIDPGSSAAANEDAVRVEPKGDIDIGDSVLNVARRSDLFFVNQSNAAVKIEKVNVNGDGNVATEIVSDDCSKQGTIPPGSRCSVEVSLTPSSPGAWTAEVLLTHDGNGRIARAKLMGKTAGTASTEKKDMGLALDTKEATPVNFGNVDVDSGKIVRSALMVNDSNDPITIYAIDVIEASNGLQRLDQGCAVDMELKPGESCPVTLVWTPKDSGQISTDLIIRHSGRLGFAVIPIRGVAKGEGKGDGKGGGDIKNADGQTVSTDNDNEMKHGIPLPSAPSAMPGMSEMERAVGEKISPVSMGEINPPADTAPKPSYNFSLIGTVGNRAIILKPDGKTVIVSSGDDLGMGSSQAQVVLVSAKSVDLLLDGKKKTILLDASPMLIEKAKLSQSASKGKEMDFSASSATASSSSATTAAAPAATTTVPPIPPGLGAFIGGGGSISGASK